MTTHKTLQLRTALTVSGFAALALCQPARAQPRVVRESPDVGVRFLLDAAGPTAGLPDFGFDWPPPRAASSLPPAPAPLPVAVATPTPVAVATPTPVATPAPVAVATPGPSASTTSSAAPVASIDHEFIGLDFYGVDIDELLARWQIAPAAAVTPTSPAAAASPPSPAVATSPAPAPAPAPIPAASVAPSDQLTSADVGAIISRVVQEAHAQGAPATIAVVDRLGAVLAVYQMAEPLSSVPLTQIAKVTPGMIYTGPQLVTQPVPSFDAAISKAVTAAYLSTSNGNAFSTRTASQIVQDHFDPGTAYAPAGPLYGVPFSSLPCSDLTTRVETSDASTLTRGPHRAPLGLSADPGGLPLYKNGVLVGGVGVKASGPYADDPDIHNVDYDIDEILALAGTIGLDAPAAIRADQISVGGLLLRYSDATTGDFHANPAAAAAFASLPAGLISVAGYYSAADGLRTGSVYGSLASGLVPATNGAISSTTPPYLLVNGAGATRYPAIAGAGPAALSAAETNTLLQNAYAVALQTRAQIRNVASPSHAAVTISIVDVYGDILGVASTPDAPMFGIDVSLQKARSAAFLSSTNADAALHADPDTAVGGYADAANRDFGRVVFASGYAWSERAIGNIARDTLPDGVNNAPNGPLNLPASQSTPFSDGLQLELVLNNLTGPDAPYCTALPNAAPSVPHPVLANGLQIFPGGFPIYRGTTLVGGIGVSGDGVDQDDLISFMGLYNAGAALHTGIGHAQSYMRADQLAAFSVHPHYANCPFAPYINSNAQNVCAGK